jgi:hypothetical protein
MFQVTWQVENPQSATGFLEIVQETMTPIVTATEAWEILHTVQPRLFEEANLDFRGKLRPGLTITAEIVRRDVRCAVEFEIIRKGKIKFIHEQIPNMATWAEIRAHFASIDEGIPSFSYYVDEENRPHMNHTLLAFRLVEGIEVRTHRADSVEQQEE